MPLNSAAKSATDLRRKLMVITLFGLEDDESCVCITILGATAHAQQCLTLMSTGITMSGLPRSTLAQAFSSVEANRNTVEAAKPA